MLLQRKIMCILTNGGIMDLLKQMIQLIVSACSRVDVDIIVALLIFYMAVVAALFLIRMIRGIHK